MNKKLLAIAVAAVTASTSAHALEVYNDDVNSFSVGGRLALSARFNDGDHELRNQSSRINFAFKRDLQNGWTAGALAEWGYDATANSSDDSHLSNRLGNITLQNDEIGHFTIGKAWSVHYDVAGKTDKMWIYGGDTAGNYTGISGDGGVHGTGRADDVIQYRHAFGGFSVAAQYQFAGDETVGDNVVWERKNGYQGAVGYQFDNGLGFSGVYAQTNFDDREDAEIYNLVASFQHDALYLAANYSESRFHDTSLDGVASSKGDALDKVRGVELFASYDINDFQLLAGYNSLEDQNSRAENTYATVGAAYFMGNMILATEYKMDIDLKDATGGDLKRNNELGLLVRYNF
ncbi:porin [Thaumasiovibrio subtropicus]|uniref:porin n=1 Tax=Thaumasiovibrio subtropicus TaxID=1891207 RepID=UPI000B34ADC1|nr:porin [Thaumasiovibrio subtropicus]